MMKQSHFWVINMKEMEKNQLEILSAPISTLFTIIKTWKELKYVP